MAAPEHVPPPRRTRIELVILAIVCLLLTTFFLPDLIVSDVAARVAADARNQQVLYQRLCGALSPDSGHLPTAGGHRLLLDLWVRGAVANTPESLDLFFTPGRREGDQHYRELRERLQRAEPIWQRLDDVSSLDTHYAARATAHLRDLLDRRASDAWIADDDEGGWTFADGTVNVLWGDGVVRPLRLQQLQERFGWPGLDEVFPTFGDRSPHPELRQLAN